MEKHQQRSRTLISRGIHRDKLQLSFLLVLHKLLALKKQLTIPAAPAVAAAAVTTTKAAAAAAGAQAQPVLQPLQVKINHNNSRSNRNLNYDNSRCNRNLNHNHNLPQHHNNQQQTWKIHPPH